MAVWKQFIDAPPPPALTFSTSAVEVTQDALILDVKRCRKRCLEFCADDLPVLSPLDQIEEVHDCELGDFVFIDAPYSSFINQYGYSGKGFYHSCLARWLLHVNVITWSQVTHRLNATAHLPHSCLRKPLEIIEACWEDPADRKLSCNSLLGLWCKKRKLYNVTTSRCELDAPAGDSLKRMIFYGEDKTVYDWVQEVSIKGPQTKYPIWLLVMCSEACRVGQAIWILEKLGCPKKSLCECKTDSIAFRVPKEEARGYQEGDW